MFTWRKFKNGKVHRVIVTIDDKSPGTDFDKVPNDWGGTQGDKEEWFDNNGRRITDIKLVEKGICKDFRGTWFNTQNIGEAKLIEKLDEEPGENFTKEKPIENEPFQKWDTQKKKFVVDVKKKEIVELEGKLVGRNI
jgi:hypothetical protein